VKLGVGPWVLESTVSSMMRGGRCYGR